jgi:hypothetical protein
MYFQEIMEICNHYRILCGDESCLYFQTKHVPIIDIFIIAIGFVLRVLAGGYITGISISQWAILLTFVLALVLAIGKEEENLSMHRFQEKQEELWMVIMYSLQILHYPFLLPWQLFVI